MFNHLPTNIINGLTYCSITCLLTLSTDVCFQCQTMCYIKIHNYASSIKWFVWSLYYTPSIRCLGGFMIVNQMILFSALVPCSCKNRTVFWFNFHAIQFEPISYLGWDKVHEWLLPPSHIFQLLAEVVETGCSHR